MIIVKYIFTSFLFVWFSYQTSANSITNCSTCGGGFGDKIGTIEPKDAFFERIGVDLICPRQNNSTYKNGATWQNTFSGYHNNNYLWAYKKSYKEMKIIIGYKTENGNFRIDGNEISFKNNWRAGIFGTRKFNDNFVSLLEKGIEVTRQGKGSKSSKKCLIRTSYYLPNTVDVNKSAIVVKKSNIKHHLYILKKFEEDQYRVINDFSRNGFKMEARFKLTDAISKLSADLAILDNNPTIVVQDKESKRLAEQEKQKRIELEKKLAALEKKTEKKVTVEDKVSKRLAEEEKQKRIKLEKKLAALEKQSKNKTKVEEISKRLAEEEKQKRLKEEQLRLETEQKRKELEQKLAILSKKNKVNVDKLVEDNTAPVIFAQSKQDGFYANISGTITDDVKLAEVLIDNKLITPNSDGSFNTKLYVPRNGLDVKILAFDMKGNKSTKTLTVERGAIEEASGPFFSSLDPSTKKVKPNPNALALIVGVANYSKTNADAIYADKDAQQFYDYARMKLGIPAKNIKELVNNKADLGEIALAVQDWIARSTKQGKTDIYLYFAGHGLASDNGKDMYLLPYDGRPRLLGKTALLRDELFKDIKQANPRSVTVFLDTCYSGTTRGTDMLIASRPIAIRALEQSIPSNFTVFSAAAGDQTSKPLEEAKHGMFSYFLMKGMEGDADSNNDKKITARELHVYVEQNVVQQSSGSQTPELQGDKDRVLVQFK